MRTKENEMLVSFEDIEPENRWNTCLNALRDEYTMSFKDVCRALKCSRSWAIRYLKPHLHYIYLSNGGGKSINYVKIANKSLGRNVTESTWFSKREFEKFIVDHIGKVTRHTICAPVEMLIEPEKRDYFDKHYISKEKIENIMLNWDSNDESELEALLQKRLDTLYKCASEKGKYILDRLPSKYKRSDSPVVECELPTFDIKSLMALHDLKDYGDSDEEIYRDLFIKGCYKIILQIPDKDGCISEKIYYILPQNEFADVKTKEMILINYIDYVSL